MGTVLGIMVVLALVGLVVVAIAKAVGGAKETEAKVTVSSLTLADLQARAPELKPRASITSKTVFGNPAAAWFESLLEKSYEVPEEAAKTYPFLRDSYGRFLSSFADFMRGVLPSVWNDDPATPATFVLGQRDAWFLVAAERTAEWLKKIATRQNELAASSSSPERWNAEIMHASNTLVMSPLPFNPSNYNVEVRCTPAALGAEAARLMEASPAVGTAPATTALSALDETPVTVV